jgi:sulfide:quinone oxidoreductase
MNTEQVDGFGVSLALRQIADNCFVAGQISLLDLEHLQRIGVQTVINNRPDHEASNQPTHAELLAKAHSLGLVMHHLPLAAGTAPSAQLLQDFKAVFDAANKPVLAFCRSGTRSTSIYVAACGEHHD